MGKRILVVDDERDILEFVGYNLSREGYEVYTAENGADALKVAEQVHPHLILLDSMMPVMDGTQTCEAIRRHPLLKDTMVVFLSAIDEEEKQVSSYKSGADDYITKPVRMRVLCSRVGAIMKRLDEKPVAKVVGIQIDETRHAIVTAHGEIILPRKEFDILQLLRSQPDRIFTRDEIYKSVWGNEIVVGERTLDVHIRRLRRKLGDNRIATIKGVGYMYRTVASG
ncbi:MAG: response regulator transcription factor [Alistipes sp.]